MIIPVQNKVDETHEARAPYNFIPLPEKVVTISVAELPDQGVYDPNRHTGYIECELTTSSPIYVRAGLVPELSKVGKETRDLPDFFYLIDETLPIIPGSSLRGMLRTLVEIVTFSKIGAVSKSKLAYRSAGETSSHDERYRNMLMQFDGKEKVDKNHGLYTPLIRGGYMIQTGSLNWAIQPAKEIDGTTYAHINIDEDKFRNLKSIKNCKNAFAIFIQTGPYQYQDVRNGFLKVKYAKVISSDSIHRPDLRAATLARSGWLKSKRSEAVIYERDTSASLLFLTDEQIDTYRNQISQGQEKLLGVHGVLNDGQPVFYLEKDGKVIFFGHGRMFRIPYPNTPFDCVPEYARPIEKFKVSDVVDMTEAIFGYSREVGYGTQRQRSYAGRVSFSDAKLIGDPYNIWLTKDAVILKVLSKPKPTTFQHYLVQKNPNLYATGQSRNGETRYGNHLNDFASPTPAETVIRGYKFYWHKGSVDVENIREKNGVIKNDILNTRIRPLKAGVKFQFRIEFENLSDVELGALMWVFNIAADENIRLKIGMGKPLGLGAIQIHSQLFCNESSERYSRLIGGRNWAGMPSENISLTDRVVKKFVESMSNQLDGEFMKHERIRALLTMLQWPGPNPEWTRYMEIEHLDSESKRGRVNEYKERPVLPTPFGVWSKHKK